MCNLELKELTVRDAILDAMYGIWSMESNRPLSVSLEGCPQAALDRIVPVELAGSPDTEHGVTLNIDTLLHAAIDSLEDFEQDFEPDYIAEGHDVSVDLEALYNLRLQLMEMCGIHN